MMPKMVMFDATIHLGQFSLASQAIRFGCKRSQILLSKKFDNTHAGLWTDNENGRVDNVVWSLPRALQDEFYPFMDRFFSIKAINQIQLEETDLRRALKLMDAGLGLAFQSAYTCAVAINKRVSELQTLYSDLLSEQVISHVRLHHGIQITQPVSRQEALYADDELEEAYQRALKAFGHASVDILEQISDPRTRVVIAMQDDFESL